MITMQAMSSLSGSPVSGALPPSVMGIPAAIRDQGLADAVNRLSHQVTVGEIAYGSLQMAQAASRGNLGTAAIEAVGVVRDIFELIEDATNLDVSDQSHKSMASAMDGSLIKDVSESAQSMSMGMDMAPGKH